MEIKAWADLFSLSLTPFEVDALERLEQEYLLWAMKRAAAKAAPAEAPKPKVITYKP